MKLISILAFCFLLQQAQAQVSNPDTMIHKMFATLKAKDEKAFVALYPNASQFGKMMRVMMEQMLKSEAMQQMMAMDEKSKNMNVDSLINTEVAKLNNPEVFAEMEKKFSKSFQKIIEKGESKGVDWKEARLVSYTMDSVSLDEENIEMFKGSGIRNIKGVIDFRSGDSAYQMSFDKIVYLPADGGWFGGEFPQLVRQGESLAADFDTDIEVGEDSLVAVDTIETQFPPKKVTKSKTKTKTPATKTKTKTKTSARKPGTKS